MKKWHSILIVMVCLFAIAVLTLSFLPGLTVGRCLVAYDGSVLLIDETTPIVLSNRTKNEELFQDLTTGDKLLVIHDGIDESYPARTGAYLVVKLGGGTKEDISEDVYTQLGALGWLGRCTGYPAETFDRIGTSYGYANMSLPQLEDWEYTLEEYTEESSGWNGCGINFRPKDQGVGSITLCYYDQWGVCGTGLKEENISLGLSYLAWQGTYDGHQLWDFISVKGVPGNYVFLNTGAESWWVEYGEEAMYIIENVNLAQGILMEEQAQMRAVNMLQEQGELDALKPGYGTFSAETGIWEIQLCAVNTGVEYTVRVLPDGTAEVAEA